MQLVTVALGVFFLIFVYLLLDSFNRQNTMKNYGDLVTADGMAIKEQPPGTDLKSGRDAVSEVVYTQDYYPWWRSTRWWNYDSYLYQKPYYNYWRRPYYYNYWYSGRPLIIGGKRYYRRRYW